MSSPQSSLVNKLHDEQVLKQTLSGATKLVVLEFVKTGSQLSSYVKTELVNIAEQLKEKAEFYELDVDKFKIYAQKFKVEALPAFVVMDKFVKKRHVVGTDDLKKAIEDAYEKAIKDKQVDSSTNNGSEQKQDEANNSVPHNVEFVPDKRSEPENPPPTTIPSGDPAPIKQQTAADRSCSIL